MALRLPKPTSPVSAALIALCVSLAGCASSGGPAPSFTKGTAVPESVATGGIAIGRSTKSDVRKALGVTAEVTFDSGYELWVYHLDGRPGSKVADEFVVLFSPSGVVTKTRIRRAPS